jgi:two-component sensor histidine kinase
MDCDSLKEDVLTVVRGGQPVETETRTDGGDPRTFILRILPYRGQNDEIQGAVLTFVDITERKRAEDVLSTMVAELNHRVKNSLAAVQSMARQTALNSPSLESFVEAFEGRLQAVATAHGLLGQAAWAHADLRSVAERIVAPMGSGRLTLDGPPIELSPGAAVSIGAILHELATNAAKYGGWSIKGGSVSLTWSLSEDQDRLTVVWAEKGGPTVGEPGRAGYGTNFVRRCTEYELQGDCRMDFAADGMRCTLRLPADTLKWRPAVAKEAAKPA